MTPRPSCLVYFGGENCDGVQRGAVHLIGRRNSRRRRNLHPHAHMSIKYYFTSVSSSLEVCAACRVPWRRTSAAASVDLSKRASPAHQRLLQTKKHQQKIELTLQGQHIEFEPIDVGVCRVAEEMQINHKEYKATRRNGGRHRLISAQPRRRARSRTSARRAATPSCCPRRCSAATSSLACVGVHSRAVSHATQGYVQFDEAVESGELKKFLKLE